ncbi:hypothetical protein AB0O34_23935 [Sphaerisporangium sp. NPDC088356]|uniref:hypothetical protein n=1 Tax=Sphaerisporangium sp. NPDC088356 TaxID=3154871 RepID=UPI00343D51E2
MFGKVGLFLDAAEQADKARDAVGRAGADVRGDTEPVADGILKLGHAHVDVGYGVQDVEP